MLPELGGKMRFVDITDVQSGSTENSPRAWRRSSSSLANGDCVEVGNRTRGFVRVRDSKNPDGPVLGFGSAQWSYFLNGVREGAFD